MTDPLHAGDDRIDPSPLPGSTSSFRTTALREPDPRRMLVVPSLGLRAVSLALVACGLGLPAAFALKDGVAPDLFGTAVFARIFTAAGVAFWVLPRRVEFDLDEGTVRVRSLLCRSDVPLSEVAAVQVADGGVHKTSKGGPYRSYQLNLVLAGPGLQGPQGLSRLGLSDHGDRAWTHAAGRRLSEFLGVPLLDPAQIGDPAGEDATP